MLLQLLPFPMRGFPPRWENQCGQCLQRKDGLYVRVCSWQYADYKEIISCTLYWQVQREVWAKKELGHKKNLRLSHLLSYPLLCLGATLTSSVRLSNPPPCLYLLSSWSLGPSHILYFFLHIASSPSLLQWEGYCYCILPSLLLTSLALGGDYYFRRVNEPRCLLVCQSRW